MRDNFSRRRVDQVHVFIHVHGAVVRGRSSQRAGELHILRQVGGIHDKLFYAVVRRGLRCVCGGVARMAYAQRRSLSIQCVLHCP